MKPSLPINWQQQILGGERLAILQLLPQIERYAAREEGAFVPLLKLSENTEFSIRLRSLLAIGRMQQAAAFLPLIKLLQKEKATHWRLLILDMLLLIAAKNNPADKSAKADTVALLYPLLTTPQTEDIDGYFLRGLIFALGQQGEAGLSALIEQIIKQPQRRFLFKDELIAEAIFQAAAGDMVQIKRYAAQDRHFYRFCLNRRWPEDLNCHFGIYPYPDYMLQKALEQGLTKKEFRDLYQWHRDKSGF